MAIPVSLILKPLPKTETICPLFDPALELIELIFTIVVVCKMGYAYTPLILIVTGYVPAAKAG